MINVINRLNNTKALHTNRKKNFKEKLIINEKSNILSNS
jgi:hypothetical protein